jgi:8-oxo-dGTP pyrophosphatase MutT (NUDIX family)
MQLDVRSILLLWHPDRRKLLLLRRSGDRKLFPNLITGIGGTVELSQGEGEDLEGAALRELEEETHIRRDQISPPRLRLSTLLSREDKQVVLLWYTAELFAVPTDLSSSDGTLAFFHAQDLPLEEMIPTAREAIPFVASLPHDDPVTYNGIYEPTTLRLITNRPTP